MDCGSFVTWALINGGLRENNDGKWTKLSRTTIPLQNYKDGVKPGDIAQVWSKALNRYSHFALVIGVKDDTVYIAEEIGAKLQVNAFSISNNKRNWHIIAMDNEYAAANGEGEMPDVDWP